MNPRFHQNCSEQKMENVLRLDKEKLSTFMSIFSMVINKGFEK